ncbi:hypothetical protein E2C01_033508 [Portunus trituberculatus]|uniref:Uncharacterized protein n=1 Tax=Portunus trituberculatus TaxID=210409 RepID=A0A5B7F2L8_PORTR|nr:hypothetical protein [Portunus trituberculatus]
MGVLGLYGAALHLLHDNQDRQHLNEAIVVTHLSGNITQDRGVTGNQVLTLVEEFLDSTYRDNAALSWKSVLETPGLRQIIVKESPCFITTAPKESCERATLKNDDINTTCFRCWSTTSMHSHICAVPDPEDDGGEGTCTQGCEHGFGYCGELGGTVWVEGRLIGEGGHGLYMSLDASKTYKKVLRRLRDLQWLTPNSRYVSVFLTTLSSTDTLARVRLHFLKYFTGQWRLTYDITLGRFPNYFPNFFKDKPVFKERPTCDKVLHYFVRGPRDRDFRDDMQDILLALPAALLLLAAFESPYFWRLFITTRDLKWEDHAVLVLNLVGLALHAGLVAGLFVSRVAAINTICNIYKNYGELVWMEFLSTQLLLCLVVLWFVKLFCLQSVLFEPLTQCTRLARGGAAALLVVPFFLLPLIVLGGGVVAITFADGATYDLRQAVVTASWAALGQARLQEQWPVLMIVRCVALLVLLPLAVAMAGVTMSYSLVAAERTKEEEKDTGRSCTVLVPIIHTPLPPPPQHPHKMVVI